MNNPLLPENEAPKTLRDEFAIVAMSVLLKTNYYAVSQTRKTFRQMADQAYEIADIMMEVRK